MKYCALVGSLWFATSAVALAEIPTLPSGLAVSLQEILTDEMQDGTVAVRLRFVVPEIASDDVSYADVSDDLHVLCEDLGIPVAVKSDQSVDQIIVSFSDRESAFGVANPGATQYFEVFTLENDTCIWEAF